MSDSVSYSKPSTMLVMISPMGPIANTHIYTDTLIYRETHMDTTIGSTNTNTAKVQ